MLGAYHTLFPELPVEKPVLRWRERFLTTRTMATLGATAGLCLVLWFGGASWAAWRLTGSWSYPTGLPAWRFVTAQEWLQQAQARAADGEFPRALHTVDYALALAPHDAALLNFQGNMYESLFDFEHARGVYEEVLRVDSGNWQARENLTFCQRVSRYRAGGLVHPSTLYGLHRLMLAQGRVAEAIIVSRRLERDLNLLQTTWQAALDQTGLPGRVTVDSTGRMTLNLAGATRPDLSLISGFPLAGLNLAYTGLDDLEPLRGMQLERLDLSGTQVHDLAPLRGMPLESLRIPGTGVVDLADLVGCPLRELDLSRTRVGDLSPLAGLPLTTLRADDTPVADLRPLAAVPLAHLSLSRSRVRDLAPLAALPLQDLALEGTGVTDLAPLKGAALRELYLSLTGVGDLAPLAGMPLKVLTLASCARVGDLRPLAQCPELEHLRLPPGLSLPEPLSKLPHLRFVQR